ncbi:queuosine precursor transporter [Nigerium massiliense]|uniref:queuosine precursor transporter n=1 Tax=Nigerium massiliense TaxID=1522317 RepID=UPI00058C5DC5|nr:queuosine precursor transporter [Nigerium massiliense]
MTRTETGATSTPASYASGGRGNYDLILAAFCGLLLISNIGATKLIQFGPRVEVLGYPVLPIITDGGAFLFPLTYVLGDVLAEVYGMRKARRAIFTGFVLAALMSATFVAVDAAPPASDWPNQDAWTAVLGFVPRIVVASLLGYLAGQFLNAYVLVRLKARANENRLWVRLVTSTVVGELADTLVFCLIAFGPLGAFLGGGSIPWDSLVNYTIVGWVYKVTVEVVFLPMTYRVIAAVKRREPDYAPAG